MINKLPTGFIYWVKEYLYGRTQSVKLSNSCSSHLPVISGIPQGSLIGPYLFNLVVGSLRPMYQSTTIIKYIDDCTFVIPISNSCDTKILQEHDNMLHWSAMNSLSLNDAKCKLMWIPRRKDCTLPVFPPIPLVTELKILGVHFTSDLKWNRHFEFVNTVASRRLYALRILKPLLDHQTLVHVYKGLILSIIEYCSPLFVGMSAQNASILEKIQRRAHVIICGESRCCQCISFPNLEERRKIASIKLLLKICNFPSHPLHELCPKKSLRSKKFIQPQSVTSRRRNSFFPLTTALANGTCII